MKTKSAEKLWKMYPEGRLHCEVTEAGSTVYKIMMSMFDRSGASVGTIAHTGMGELTQLKEEALQKLLAELEQSAA